MKNSNPSDGDVFSMAIDVLSSGVELGAMVGAIVAEVLRDGDEVSKVGVALTAEEVLPSVGCGSGRNGVGTKGIARMARIAMSTEPANTARPRLDRLTFVGQTLDAQKRATTDTPVVAIARATLAAVGDG